MNDFQNDDLGSLPTEPRQFQSKPWKRRMSRSGRDNYARSKPASTFQYKPLDRSTGAIRLIKLSPLVDGRHVHCQISRAHLSTAEYIAISYVWGRNSSYRTVWINGDPFHVRPNLYAFLRHAATTHLHSLFWIDAICINQNDIEERNGHVQHMGAIFANATRVISWLGDKSNAPSEPTQRDTPRDWICCDVAEHPRPAASSQFRRCCDWKIPTAWSWGLMKHEYWSRLWIAQELGLARRVDILWKGRYYDWSRMKNHLNLQTHRRRLLRSRQDPRSKAFLTNLNYIAKLPIARYFKFIGSGPLGNLVPEFAHHECEIGHDHIYGLLALARDGSAFEPDYRESPISLLYRLMNFCYDNPIAAFTRKLGVSLGLEPHTSGIPVTILGHPHLHSNSAQLQHIRYHLTDKTDHDIRNDDILIRLPDTYLNLLFRPSTQGDADAATTRLDFVARVSLTSTLVEKTSGRFGSSRRPAQWKRDIPTVLDQALEHMQKALLKVDPTTQDTRLFCDWQTILAIFESSETEAPQGRLESRIRKWISCSSSDTEKQLVMFTVSLA